MITKGQLIEIPAASPLYKQERHEPGTQEAVLRRESRLPEYDLFDGFLVGDHSGVEHFKLGQRKGINVGGKKAPLYVIGINPGNNRIFVGEGKDHPGLWRKVLCYPAELLQWKDGFTVSKDALQKGIPVSIVSGSSETAADALLYLFGTEFFLEANEQFPITLLDEELAVLQENTIIANIKNNNINRL